MSQSPRVLNTASPIPLYHQLAELLSTRIRAGEYPPGSKIPSEPELAKQFRIGRPTVREATDLLVLRRLITRKRGSGTFVREAPPEVDIFSLAGTLASFKNQGLELKTHIIVRLARRQIEANADPENPFSGREAFTFVRLSKLDGEPVLLESLYLDPAAFPGFDKHNVAGRSLANLIEEQYYKKPDRGRQTFRIGSVRGKHASALEVTTRAPVLLVKRVLSFSDAENAIFSELYCRTDKVVFSQNVGVGA